MAVYEPVGARHGARQLPVFNAVPPWSVIELLSPLPEEHARRSRLPRSRSATASHLSRALYETGGREVQEHRDSGTAQ